MCNYLDTFKKYISNYDMNDSDISLKYSHSLRVMGLMEELSVRLNLNEEEKNIAKLIGLLHDIGRFEQIEKYHIISDIKSNMDHAEAGVNYLFIGNHIRDFIYDSKYDDIILKAIKYHNKIELPNNLNNKELMFAKMIRDMDKVDIFRALLNRNASEFNKNELTDIVLNAFNNKEIIDNKYKQTKTDECLCALAFIYDINFKETFEILKDTSNLNDFIKSVKVNSESIDLWNNIINCVNDIIEIQ